MGTNERPLVWHGYDDRELALCWRALLELAAGSELSPDGDPAARCLDAVFDTGSMAPRERARQFRDTQPDSPLLGRLAVFAANSPEQEARAIDLQVRQWLLDGRQPVGIVTEDRRLARRVRALLERQRAVTTELVGIVKPAVALPFDSCVRDTEPGRVARSRAYTGEISAGDVDVFRVRRRPGVSRRDKRAIDTRTAGNLPREGMLPPATAENEAARRSGQRDEASGQYMSFVQHFRSHPKRRVTRPTW